MSLTTSPVEIQNAKYDNERSTDDAEPRRGIDRGLEEGRGNDVLNLRSARQRIHRKRKRSEGDRGRDQSLGDITPLEQFGGEWIDGEYHDKQRRGRRSSAKRALRSGRSSYPE